MGIESLYRKGQQRRACRHMLRHSIITTALAFAWQLRNRTIMALSLLTHCRVLHSCHLCVSSAFITCTVIPVCLGRLNSNSQGNIPSSIQDEDPMLCAAACTGTTANKTSWAKEVQLLCLIELQTQVAEGNMGDAVS